MARDKKSLRKPIMKGLTVLESSKKKAAPKSDRFKKLADDVKPSKAGAGKGKGVKRPRVEVEQSSEDEAEEEVEEEAEDDEDDAEGAAEDSEEEDDEVHLRGFSSGSDSSDDDEDVDEAPPLDVSKLPTIAKDDETVRRRLEKAKKQPVSIQTVIYPRDLRVSNRFCNRRKTVVFCTSDVFLTDSTKKKCEPTFLNLAMSLVSVSRVIKRYSFHTLHPLHSASSSFNVLRAAAPSTTHSLNSILQKSPRS